MYKILLCCQAGVTSNMLVQAMKQEAKVQGVDTLVWAIAKSSIDLSWGNADCILVAPQNAGDLKEIQTMVNGAIPVALINDDSFINMDGKAVLNQALNLITK